MIQISLGTTDIEYDDDFHVYRVDGTPWPSVTQILSVVEDLSHVDPTVLRAAGALGTKAHKLCERLTFTMPELDEFQIENEPDASWLRPRLQGYRMFLKDYQPEILGQEVTVAHKQLRYCGRADLVTRMRDHNSKDEKLYVSMIDIKTGRESPSWALQTAAYAHAITEPKIQRRYALKLGDGCRTPFYQLVPYGDIEADMRIFISCLNIFRWRQQR